MNAPGNWTTSKLTTGAEKSEMKSIDNGQNKLAVVNQEIKDARYWEKKVGDAMRRVSQRLPAGKAPAKLLGGIALAR